MNISAATTAAFGTSRHLAAALVAGALISTGAAAQNVGTAFSDLWWNPAESGWGVNIDHQQDVMFLTFFIYRADKSPYWLVGIFNRTGSNPLAAPPVVFTGDVYETTGPVFSGPFDPAQAGNHKVGTGTFSGNLTSATLEYTVNGVIVTKSIVRQTLRNLDYTGDYLAATASTSVGCANAASNNVTAVDNGTLTVAQSGAAFQMTMRGKTATCTYHGTYSQQGSVGQVDSGSYSCDDSSSGTFTMSSMQWTPFGMTASVAANNGACTLRGYLGGITKATATIPPQWATRGFAASPDVYQLIGQDNQSLMYLGTWKPGQRDQFHSHPPGSMLYWLTDCSLRTTLPDGSQGDSIHPAGFTTAFDVASHWAQNVGSAVCMIVFVEPK